jgi:hypothetical protein
MYQTRPMQRTRPTVDAPRQLPPRPLLKLAQPDELGAILNTELGPGVVLKIMAVAGAGKSSALREIARRHPEMRTLLTVFNRSAADDQATRCADMPHVRVLTLDALVFEATADVHGGKVSREIDVRDIGLPTPLWAGCVRAALAAYCASSDANLAESHVHLGGAPLPFDAQHVRASPSDVLAFARLAWLRVCDPGSGLSPTHGVLGKIYQLGRAALESRYDLILLDEAHDCTGAQLASVLGLPVCAKVLVYDPHQRINGFRHAVEAGVLESVPCTHVRTLSMSWRYGADVALLAQRIIRTFKQESTLFSVRGNLGVQSMVHVLAGLPARQAVEQGTRLAVLGSTNIEVLSSAYTLLQSDPALGLSVGFAAGGAFAHVHRTRGAQIVHDLARVRLGHTSGMIDVDVARVAQLARDGHAWAPAVILAEEQQICTDGTGVNWMAARNLVANLEPATVMGMVALLGSCNRGADAPITFSTVHVAKGLSWPWVALLDSFFLAGAIGPMPIVLQYGNAQSGRMLSTRDALAAACRRRLHTKPAESDAIVNLVYVAVTRAETRLFLPQNLAAWLQAK